MNKKIVFLPYDFDTAIGINNEGSLVFSYNLEGTDHVDGADVFNGQQSVLWNNLRDTFQDEIISMYKQLRSDGILSYENIENRFEEHQNKWPEALFNEDAKYKYLDPLEDDNDATYLPMLQGSKAEQRKWWLFNRFRYMDSKFNAGDALTDYIQLRGYAKGNITITPYADIYPTIKYGSYLVQTRGARNQEYELVCPLSDMNDTEIYIYSASALSSIGDISSLKVGLADFSRAVKLTEIKVGDSTNGYSNPNLKSLTLGNNTLLQSIDIRNCSNLGTDAQKTIDLSGCTGLEEVYFDGTAISGVDLPNGGVLKKLHLPGTITYLTIRNHNEMTEFVCPDYSHITTLWLENPTQTVDTEAIVTAMPEGGRVRLFGFHWEVDTLDDVKDLFDKLDTMRGLDQNGNNTPTAQVFGDIVVNTAHLADITDIQDRYPDVRVTYTHYTTTMTFKDFFGETVIATQTIVDGGDGTSIPVPAIENTESYQFSSAVGWSNSRMSDTAMSNPVQRVTTDRTLYAAYTYSVVTYTVRFTRPSIHGGGDLYVVQLLAGETPVYRGETPTSIRDEFVFDKWEPALAPIHGNVTYTAVFRDTSSQFLQFLAGTLEHYESDTATVIADHAFQQSPNLKTVKTSATSIGEYAFDNCNYLETVDLTATGPVTIGDYVFKFSWTRMKYIIIRSESVATIGEHTFDDHDVFWSRDAAIYVPDVLVASYKANAAWINVRHRIYPISAYPVTEFDSITDDWDTIVSKIASGTATYEIGDTKTIDLGNEGSIRFAVIGRNLDELADGSGKAAYTFYSMSWLKTTRRWNPPLEEYVIGTGTLGGWEYSELRAYLRDTIFPTLPASLQTGIKTVKKYSQGYEVDAGGTSATLNKAMLSSDTLFELSSREKYGVENQESQGVIYSDAIAANMLAIGNGSGVLTRTANSNSPASIKISATASSSASSNIYHNGFGFCL